MAVDYDGAGALIKRGDNHLHYGIDGRITKTGLNASASHPQAVSYTYNLLGQRLLKSDARLSGNVGTPNTRHTVYAEDGIGSTVLGQYRNQRSSDSGAPAGEMDSTEVIYLPTANGPLPIATQINGRLYAIDSDHLNTPRRLTNSQGQVAWQWLLSGYGEVPPTTGAQGYAQNNTSSRNSSEAIKFDLRYPGQQWDEETGLAYNLHRYYDAATGRYIQADPIGLEGGWNRFGYVSGSPLSKTDPTGLLVEICSRTVDIDWLPRGSSGYLPRHNWIKTDSTEVGMGAACVIGQGCSDRPGDKTYTKDHTGQSSEPGASCTPVPDVDEQCVNAELRLGRYLGRWHPMNQCQSFAQEVIEKCSSSGMNRPYIGYPNP